LVIANKAFLSKSTPHLIGMEELETIHDSADNWRRHGQGHHTIPTPTPSEPIFGSPFKYNNNSSKQLQNNIISSSSSSRPRPRPNQNQNVTSAIVEPIPGPSRSRSEPILLGQIGQGLNFSQGSDSNPSLGSVQVSCL
jgi:hypothetical protein